VMPHQEGSNRELVPHYLIHSMLWLEVSAQNFRTMQGLPPRKTSRIQGLRRSFYFSTLPLDAC